MTPTTHELEVLRIINGEDVPGWTWGAAMSAVLSHLRGAGLVALDGAGKAQITDAGRAALEEDKP